LASAQPTAARLAPVRPDPTPAVASPTATTPAAAPDREGVLQLRILPWAEVSIDGRVVGTTPIPRQSLPSGRHTLRLVNPRYEPVEREVHIRPGETLRVEVNLEREAKPRN
jgi:serine/threonine-protein kinase